jgi:exodeoxyribonuclease V gamma subunit
VTAFAFSGHGLILHTSNRLEALATQLAAGLQARPASPLQPEIVIVQSQGMARWLQLELATRLGLCANVQFPFPRAFVRQVFRAFDPSVPETDPIHPSLVTWQVWELLPWLARQDGGEPVARYLQGDPEGRKRFQLAGRIARLFDDYAVFRPDLVLGWDQGVDTHWQARLWRQLREVHRQDHAALLRSRFLGQVERANECPPSLPQRVHLFGISALPPFYVEVFERLGKWLPVQLFLLQPSAHYWGDVVSAKAALKRSGRIPPAPSELGRHEGNSLLASLGGQGRDFLNVLLSVTEFNARDNFADPGRDSLLHAIQSDLLNLRNSDASGNKTAVQAADNSMQVHSCHSPLRELEVLQDHILHWFSTEPNLRPRDILVMTPDIETYAPLIDAVFAAPSQRAAGPGIPFSVADRSAGSASQILSAFARILKLAGSRLGVATVLELLETPAVRKRFELSEAEVFQAREWLRTAGVRWGEDEQHRRRLQLPALRQNTWADGLDRLLLGYAMAGGNDELFAGILPCDGAEGNVSESFGRLLRFAHRVFAAVRELETPHPLAEWVALLRRMVAEFFAESEEVEFELHLLRDILNQLDEHRESAQVTEPLPLSVILEHLTPILEDDQFHSGFLTGRVTFGALKPMRSIPFKIICLLGMNDSGFPRSEVRLGFDLMAAEPRLGDQSKREDDRYLFLETLLSARQRLYLSYVGQSIRDNSQAPPSVLVSELLDYVDQGFEIPPPAMPTVQTPAGSNSPAAMAPSPGRARGSRRHRVPENQLSLSLPCFDMESPGACPNTTLTGAAAADAVSMREHLIVRHRLQAFSSDYFTAGGRLFSYSAENFRGCQALSQIEPLAPFVSVPLPEPDNSWRTIDIQALAEFFANPARYFLTRRMDIRLPRPMSELTEREPMDLDGIDRFTLKTELLEKRLAGAALVSLRPAFLADGRLPLGKAGELLYLELCESIEEFHERLTRFRPRERLPVSELDLMLGPFRLLGRFEHVTSVALLHYRPAVVAPKDRMRAWIQHLAWCATNPGQKLASVVIGEPPKGRSSAGVEYRPLEVQSARGLLGRLLEHYWRGLSEPLRFFPKTSLKFAEIDFINADRRPEAWKDSLRQSRKEWDSGRFNRGEDDDEHYRICFHHFDPLDGDFMALARSIGQPLLQHEGPL